MKIKDLMREAHETAKSKGWWDKPRTVLEQLMLMVTELAEATEDIRANRGVHLILMEGRKPTGFAIELADVLIRIFDTAEYYEIDLEHAIRLKMEYNKTREYRHGNKSA